MLRFELYKKNQLVYAIFFGTQNLVGCDKMKQAIWKVAPFGDYVFRSHRSGQRILGDEVIDFAPLKKSLTDKFRGQEWVDIGTIMDFVASDATEFHTGRLKKGALVPMEESNQIRILTGTRQRKRHFS